MTTPAAASRPASAGDFRTGPAAAAATQAVVDAIGAGQLRDGQADDSGLRAAKATAASPRPAAATVQAGTSTPGWAGREFTRPGPGAEVPQDLYRAALEDALAYTTDHDGCRDCDRDQLCDSHTARAVWAERYQLALQQELEAGA